VSSEIWEKVWPLSWCSGSLLAVAD
jgi:hypothetical protein